MTSSFTLKPLDHGIFALIFDVPEAKVNVFSEKTISDLESVLALLENSREIRALLIFSGKKDSFIAGADLHQFAPAFHDRPKLDKMIERGHNAFRRLAELPFPTISVIDGACLGGGLEFALACSFRIATTDPKCEMALPETTLGIIPGWGGTQRLPRLIALSKAIEMITSGKRLKGSAAFKAHLVDELISRPFIEEKAILFAQKVLDDAKRPRLLAKRRERTLFDRLLEGNPIGRSLLFSQARKQILKKTEGHYPAPLKALDLIEKTYLLPLKEGLRQEARYFAQASEQDFQIAENLIHLFLAQEKAKKGLETFSSTLSIDSIQNIVVLGAGTMGGTLSWLFAKNGYSTRVKEIDEKSLLLGLSHAKQLFDDGVKRKRWNHEEASLGFHRLSWTLNDVGLEKADFILESIVEDLEIKKQVLSDLEKKIPKETLIVTNTSSLKVDEIAAALEFPERFLGMHFFNPANRMPLVEIVPGAKSSPASVQKAFLLAKKLGKTPLLVGDCNGFLVNRIFMRAALVALDAFEEGIDIEALDREMKAYGMPMGSFELIDEVGVDVVYKVSHILEKAYGQRMKAPPILGKLMEKRAFGKKAGIGFYKWSDDKRGAANPNLKEWQKTSNLPPAAAKEKILKAMKEESELALKEKIALAPWEVDLSLILGTGFPPFRGGLFQFKGL